LCFGIFKRHPLNQTLKNCARNMRDSSAMSGRRPFDHRDPFEGRATDRTCRHSGEQRRDHYWKAFVDHTSAEIDRTLALNTLALMDLSSAVLPGMIARRRGHIVNMASAAGLVVNPRMSVYCSSKWAVIGWSESLLLEMRSGRTGVNVTTVMPYYIKTGMFAGVNSSPLMPLMEPEDAARAVFSAIEKIGHSCAFHGKPMGSLLSRVSCQPRSSTLLLGWF
jgi:NAD(P)-dependent dehydrogenase (short-subunit alcohol dehydrogenase family)